LGYVGLRIARVLLISVLRNPCVVRVVLDIDYLT